MRLLLLLLFASHFCNAQVGFFGKKNILEVHAHGNVPVITIVSNLVFGGINEQPFKAKDGKLIEMKDWFNYGFSIQNIHYYKKSKGIGLELSYDFQNTSGPYQVTDNNSSGSYSYTINHEMLKINTLTIMPKLEFGSSGSSLPSGLSHQLGIGFTLTSIVKKKYLAEYDDFNLPLIDAHKENLNKLFAKQNYKGFSIMYQMNYRTPLNKRLFLNWGMRYSLNLCALGRSQLFDAITNNYAAEYDESYQDLKRSIRMTRLTNTIQFTLGLGFSY